MPLYWILIILAIVAAINSDEVSRAVNINGKGKKYMIILCAVMIAVITVIIKNALH